MRGPPQSPKSNQSKHKVLPPGKLPGTTIFYISYPYVYQQHVISNKKGRKVLFPLSRSFAVATPATDSSASTAPGTRTAAGPAAVAATACGAARAARAVSSGWAACTAGPPRGARKPGGRPGVRRSWHVEEKKEESHNAG